MGLRVEYWKRVSKGVCFSDFLFFWRDLWVILVLCIFACCPVFCESLHVLRFWEFLVLIAFCEFLNFLCFREFIVLLGFGSALFAGLAHTLHFYPRPQHPPCPHHRKQQLGGGSPPPSWDRDLDTYEWRARQHRLCLMSCTLSPSHALPRPHTHPSTHTTPLYASTLHHTPTPSTRHVRELDKTVSQISSQTHWQDSRLVGMPSVNSQPWRFTNNSLSLSPIHSLSVCLFLMESGEHISPDF